MPSGTPPKPFRRTCRLMSHKEEIKKSMLMPWFIKPNPALARPSIGRCLTPVLTVSSKTFEKILAPSACTTMRGFQSAASWRLAPFKGPSTGFRAPAFSIRKAEQPGLPPRGLAMKRIGSLSEKMDK